MAFVPLTRADVKVKLMVTQDDLPIRGNAMASGDDAYDREVEDRIIRELEAGNVWAWAVVEVKVSWGPMHASTFLGACSYEGQQDFERCGYYDDMVEEAIEILNGQLEGVYTTLRFREAEAAGMV